MTPSEWTVDTLRAEVAARLVEVDRRVAALVELRAESNARLQALGEAVALLAARLDRLEGRGEGMTAGKQALVMTLAGLSSLAAIVSVVLVILRR